MSGLCDRCGKTYTWCACGPTAKSLAAKDGPNDEQARKRGAARATISLFRAGCNIRNLTLPQTRHGLPWREIDTGRITTDD